MPRKRVREEDGAVAAPSGRSRKASHTSDVVPGAAAGKRRARGGSLANPAKDTAAGGSATGVVEDAVEVS